MKNRIIRDMNLLLRHEVTGEWRAGTSEWKKAQRKQLMRNIGDAVGMICCAIMGIVLLIGYMIVF